MLSWQSVCVNPIYQSHICCLVHRNINLVFSPQHVTQPLLGAGVVSLIQHLSCAPHLDRCALACVDELSADVWVVTWLSSPYHLRLAVLWLCFFILFFFFFTVYLYSAIVFRHFLFAMIILHKTRVLLLKTNHQFEQIHSKCILFNWFFKQFKFHYLL